MTKSFTLLNSIDGIKTSSLSIINNLNPILMELNKTSKLFSNFKNDIDQLADDFLNPIYEVVGNIKIIQFSKITYKKMEKILLF